MKIKINFPTLILGLMSALVCITLLNSCAPSSEKEPTTISDELNESLSEAKEGINETKKESIEKYEEFKLEAERIMDENKKTIEKLKIDIKSKSREAKADLEKELTALEAKNQALKEKIKDYNQEGNDAWESFKLEITRDLDKLGEALKDFAKNNVK